MSQYDNTNSGILTRNDKGDNDKRPDYRGSINVAGTEYWISGWIRDGREGTKLEGQKYLSLKVEAKENQATAQKPAARPAGGGGGTADEDIPFAPLGMWE